MIIFLKFKVHENSYVEGSLLFLDILFFIILLTLLFRLPTNLKRAIGFYAESQNMKTFFSFIPVQLCSISTYITKNQIKLQGVH